jgi:hypothetical protein
MARIRAIMVWVRTPDVRSRECRATRKPDSFAYLKGVLRCRPKTSCSVAGSDELSVDHLGYLE